MLSTVPYHYNHASHPGCSHLIHRQPPSLRIHRQTYATKPSPPCTTSNGYNRRLYFFHYHRRPRARYHRLHRLQATPHYRRPDNSDALPLTFLLLLFTLSHFPHYRPTSVSASVENSSDSLLYQI